MAYTTYSEFLLRLGQLHVTGVTRRYLLTETPPASLNTADLPAMWVQEPKGEAEVISGGGGGRATWQTFNGRLIVATCPAAQSTLATAFNAAVTMMDSVVYALQGSNLADSATTWELRMADVTVAGVVYWAVIAEVHAKG